MSDCSHGEAPPTIGRRGFIVAGAHFAALAVSSSAMWRHAVAAGTPVQDPLLDYVCDQVIPATDTPGALGVGVPAFLVVAIPHGLAGAKGDEIARLRRELDKRAGEDFMRVDASRRLAALSGLDAEAFGSGHAGHDSAWRTVKSLIVLGYYTSEVGGSKELQYAPVPGQFKPDVPVRPGDRAVSNDWNGLAF